MTEQNIIQEELRSLDSTLPFPGAIPGYRVPVDYFETFAATMLSRIREMDIIGAKEELSLLSPLLNSISREMPYATPSGYFDNLAGLDKDENELSSALVALKNKSTYTVPDGYFEQLPSALLKKINGSQTARVISLGSRKWIRYAAAAIIAGIVAGILIFNSLSSGTTRTSLAWIEKNTKKVSPAEINSLIELAKADTSSALARSTTTEDVKHLVKDIPDKEIQDFLNDTQIEETAAEDELFLN